MSYNNPLNHKQDVLRLIHPSKVNAQHPATIFSLAFLFLSSQAFTPPSLPWYSFQTFVT
ncbi:unnamed protein product, partial [Candidula unifasciata]